MRPRRRWRRRRSRLRAFCATSSAARCRERGRAKVGQSGAQPPTGAPMTDKRFAHLTAAEKLQLIEDLWDDLMSAPEGVPVHDWQRDELDRRKVCHANDPASG